MRIAVISGDGIGRDVTAEALKALIAAGQVFGRRFDLDHLPWSADHYLKTNSLNLGVMNDRNLSTDNYLQGLNNRFASAKPG